MSVCAKIVASGGGSRYSQALGRTSLPLFAKRASIHR